MINVLKRLNNNRYIGVFGEKVYARYIGKHGKSVRILPTFYAKLNHAFEEGFTPGKSVGTVNRSTVNRLLTVPYTQEYKQQHANGR